MKNIKFFEFEETYHEDKANHEYPTVSYTQDTDKVWYMVKETILPNVNINELSTHFINGEYYVKEASLFQEIWNKFLMDDLMKIRIDDKGILELIDWQFNTINTIDVNSEPLYINYLSNLTYQFTWEEVIYQGTSIEIKHDLSVYINMGGVSINLANGKCQANVPM